MKRLNDAVDRIAAAVKANAARPRDVPAQVQALADDRSRMADDLDEARARAERLAQVNADVSRRLVGAMETVRGAIAAREGK